MNINRPAIFTISGIVLILGVFLYFVEYYQADRSEKQAKLFLNLGATKVQRLINQTHEVLFDLSRSRVIKTRDRIACTELFNSYVERYKEYNGFLLADAKGDVVCSNHLLAGSGNIADPAPF